MNRTSLVSRWVVLGAMLAIAAVGCASSNAGSGEPVEKLSPLESGKPVEKLSSPEPVQSGEEAQERARAGKVEFVSCKEHLDAIADCFFKVVTQIQREPKQDEPMARFLGANTWTISNSEVHEACTPLGLDEKSTRLLLGDSSEVLVTKSEESRDELAGGITTWYLAYRFSSPACTDTAVAYIELSVGG